MPPRDLVIVSNRGPLSFRYDDEGALATVRGGGGLVTSLGPAVEGTGATWMAAALSDADREAASAGVVDAEGFRLRSLVVDEGDYRQFYDVVANATLWFLHHGLWDLVRRPRFDRHWHQAWATFRAVNAAFADAVAAEAPEGATVLVHDYHLSLVGARLRKLRPDLATAYFHHTPFCTPTELRTLPTAVAVELLEGMAGSGACGFHSARWQANFEACCREVLGHVPPTFVAPAAANVDDITSVEAPALDFGGRRVIARVDRIELSKNIVRGFLAYDELLRSRPDLRGQVVFAASIYPSRQSLVDYLAYANEVEAVVDRVNAEWGAESWTPIVLDTSDDFPRSVAVLRSYDVLLVNPIRDGLNLVAKEGPIVNERDGVLVLSPEAGAWAELGPATIEAHPFDIMGTAEALGRALDLDAAERARRAAELRTLASTGTSHDWLAAQVAAAR
ncbi:MAG TPA: trehalose-6-phosphate synthase [Acidimicrobiales bacterium]|nr:trehalose-6-phosphate synthase [Acidimicrobiales bacterium]